MNVTASSTALALDTSKRVDVARSGQALDMRATSSSVGEIGSGGARDGMLSRGANETSSRELRSSTALRWNAVSSGQALAMGVTRSSEALLSSRAITPMSFSRRVRAEAPSLNEVVVAEAISSDLALNVGASISSAINIETPEEAVESRADEETASPSWLSLRRF